MRTCSTLGKFFLLFLMAATSTWARLQAQDCNGTPVAGTVAAPGGTQGCPGTAIALSLTGESSGNGLTFQWQSSTDNINWINLNGATGTAFTYTMPNGFAGVYIRAAVTCTNSNLSAYTAPVQITLPQIASYATLPFIEGFEGDWIHICVDGQLPQPTSSLSWNNLPATTDNSWRREDNGASANWSEPAYGSYMPTGAQGSTHSARFHSTYATSPGILDLYINCNTTLATKKLSFDYINPDGTDSLEVLLSTDGGNTFKRLYGAYTAANWVNESVIFTASSPTAILRFMGVEDNGNTDIGLDNVNVQPVVGCSGTPPIAKAVTSNSSVCHGSSFNLSLTGLPAGAQGFTYQWEYSANGTSGWTGITGATDSAYTDTESVKTYYRAVVTCSLSGDSSASAVVAVNIPSPMKGTYSINSGAATAGTNFKSFTDAANALQCAGIAGPVVFSVKPGGGTYNEQMMLSGIAGISPLNTITFKGNGNTIKFSSQSQGNGVVTINGSSYITLDSLIIDASPAAADTATHFGVGILLQNGANNNTVQSCRIMTDSIIINDNLAAMYAGITLDGTGSYNVFSGNSISGGNAGIQAQTGGTGNQYINNKISQFKNSGIQVQFAGNIEDSLLIQGNFISSPYRKNGASPSGIAVFGGSNLVISKNRVFDITTAAYVSGISAFAINEQSASVSSITNNLLYNINGLQGMEGILCVNYNNMLAAFNTMSFVDSAEPASSTIDGIFIGGGNTANVAIENNLFSINAKGSGTNHAINLSTGIQPGFILDYNDYFISGTAHNSVGYSAPGNITSKTLAEWQQATTFDAHSVAINPVFEDTATGDYKPSSMDVDNRGTPIAGITTDILNIIRNTETPDVGAYEFKTCQPVRGVYTINSGAAAGTARTFTSFNAAYDAMRCGIDSAVIFNVKPGSGPYNEQLNMGYIQGSSAKNTVTFKGNGATIRFSSTDQAHKAVVLLNGTQHITLDSLVIDATPPAGQSQNNFGFGLQMYNYASYNTVHGCTIISDSSSDDFLSNYNFQYQYSAVSLTGNAYTDSVFTNHNMFDHNKTIGGFYGMFIEGNAVADSFINNDVSTFMGYGIQLLHTAAATPADYNDSLLIEGNVVHSTTQGYTAIEVLEANNVTISKNIVHDLKSYGNTGIILDACNGSATSNCYIVNNLVYDVGKDSTYPQPSSYAFGITNFSSGNVFMEHNTIALHNTASSAATVIHGITVLIEQTPGAAADIVVKNNLVSIDGNGKSQAACILLVNQTPPVEVYNIDYNNYYTGNNPNTSVGLLNFGTFIPLLADWRTQTGQDTNSVSIDPIFTNDDSNYRPTNYQLDNLGIPLGVTTDIVDSLRSTTHPDMGCYEFRVCPPNLGDFQFSKNYVCIGDPISFAAADTTVNYHAVDEWAWDFNNGTTANIQNPSAMFNQAGTFNVKLTATTNDNCIYDTTRPVTIIDCYKQLFIPNAFTPNGDGLNDVLRVYGNDIQQIRFMVFNQWGEKLFETTDASQGWDGTQNGKPQPTGVYMYVCKVTLNDGKETIKKGAVNLIR